VFNFSRSQVIVPANGSASIAAHNAYVIFCADLRYFNGIKIIITSASSLKVVDSVASQGEWDSYVDFTFDYATDSIVLTNKQSYNLNFYCDKLNF